VGLGFEAGRGVSGVCHTVDLVMMRVGKDSEAETAKKSRAETAKTRRRRWRRSRQGHVVGDRDGWAEDRKGLGRKG
jgi:hypothetical protein